MLLVIHLSHPVYNKLVNQLKFAKNTSSKSIYIYIYFKNLVSLI